MVMLQKWSLMEGEWLSYGGGQFSAGRMLQICYRGDHFNGGKMVRLQVASLLEGEWSCYRGGQLNGGRIVILQRWPV